MFMSHRSLRAWSWVHKWSSLICTPFMLMLCITGLPLIFHHEIEHLTMPKLETVAPDAPPASLDAIVAAANAARPGERVGYLFFDRDEPLVMLASAKSMTADFDDFFLQVYDTRTGKRIDAPPRDEGFMYVMLKLHIDMFAGLPGMLFLGFMGLLLIVAIVSGVVLYAPFMRKLEFGAVRLERGPRVRWLDLHNLLGIVTAMWLFVVGFTGAVNTLGTIVERIWQGSELVEMASSHKERPVPEPAQWASVDAAVAAVQRALPDKHPVTFAFPGTVFASPHHYGVYLIGDSALTSRLLTPALLDATTGEVTATRDMPLYVKALFVSQPLHFGDYGELPLKLLWALFDLVAIAVLGSGLYLWLKPGRRGAGARTAARNALLEEVMS